MKKILISMLVMTLVGCASAPRTKWTDPTMRLMIDPSSIDAENYVRVQSALVNTGKFVVVDRASALSAIKREQESLHQNEADRFEDKEKWAFWGKLYGVGSVVIAHNQCKRVTSMWNSQNVNLVCNQYLSLVNANTGQVLLAVEGQNSETMSNDLTYFTPGWDDTAEKFAEKFPKEFETHSYSGNVENYRELAKERAIRQKEAQAKDQVVPQKAE